MKYCKRIAVILSAIIFFMSIGPQTVHAITLSDWLQGEQETNESIDYDLSLEQADYADVQKQYAEQGYKRTGNNIRLTADQATNVQSSSYLETENVIISDETAEDIKFSFNCAEAGLYALRVRYCAMNEITTPLVRSISIDGQVPFAESEFVTLYRLWEDDGEPTINLLGNEVAPGVKQVFEYQTVSVYDEEGMYEIPMEWYLSEGEHELTVSYVENPMAIEYLEFYSLSELPSYKEVEKDYKAKGYKKASKPIYLEAEEQIVSRNQSIIRLVSNSDPTVSKTEAGKLLCNTIGGGLWGDSNASITWKFEVQESGLYQVSYHYIQNFNSGLPSYRRIEIDGEVPYKELSQYKFVYGLKWQTEILSDDNGEPYWIYLEKGEHTMTMTATLGEMSQVVDILEEDSQTLSNLILQITMLTGQSPDPNYDYRLDTRIPGLMDSLENIVKNMDTFTGMLKEFSEGNPSLAGQIDNCKDQVQRLLDDPFYIAVKLEDLENVLSTYGTALTTLTSQQLSLDNIQFITDESDIVKIKGGFWASLWGGIVNFFQSFYKDYDAVRNVGMADVEVKETLDIWVARGEQWGELLQELADSDFTPRTGIGVNIHIVPAGQLNSGSANALLLAISSNSAPDVALGVAAGSVGEFAIRNAVVDVSLFDDYEEVIERYNSKLMTPFTYKDAVYGLPETQNFKVLMYRKDVLSTLGIKVPETWDDLYNYVLPVLYQNNMEFYNPIDSDPFVFQCGGTYYNEDMTESTLDSDASFKGMEELFELYTVHGVPVAANFFNRFRSGEMPMGIGTMTDYMQMRAAAPELKGRWGIAVIPGHEQEDGTINHSQGAAVSEACMILSQSEKQEEAWEFLKWWTSDEVQIRYGNEIEAAQGEAARWNSANTNAFASMAWPREDFKIIADALSQVDHSEIVLGGYFSARHVTNAFNRTCVSGTMNARDSIEQAVKDINKELLRRRESTGN